MTGVASLSLVVGLGFTLLMTFHLSRYWLLRQSGYLLFFAVITAGLLVTFYLTTYVIEFEPLGSIVHVDTKSAADSLLMPVHPVVHIVAISITALIGLTLNLLYPRSRAAKIVAEHTGDLIEVTLQDASVRPTTVEITLVNGKSYVGFPLESGITTLHDSDISLLPALSGYRDEKTKELKITTNYDRIIEQLRDQEIDENPPNFALALPKEQIVSVREFDIETYLLFAADKQNTTSS